MAPSHRQPQYHRRLVGFAPIFCRGATVRRSGLAAGHVGEGEGQIAQVVLQKARALYLKKVSEGAVKNPCYLAMDATRPGGFGRLICETDQTFRAAPAGHGDGRDPKGIVDFANGVRCAKNFSNAMDSKLTTSGASVTGEEITSFKRLLSQLIGKIRGFEPCGRAMMPGRLDTRENARF